MGDKEGGAEEEWGRSADEIKRFGVGRANRITGEFPPAAELVST